MACSQEKVQELLGKLTEFKTALDEYVVGTVYPYDSRYEYRIDSYPDGHEEFIDYFVAEPDGQGNFNQRTISPSNGKRLLLNVAELIEHLYKLKKPLHPGEPSFIDELIRCTNEGCTLPEPPTPEYEYSNTDLVAKLKQMHIELKALETPPTP